MTTNIDRAAEVIAESITRDSAPAHEIVADLEHDGLIMPDLPDKEQDGKWKVAGKHLPISHTSTAGNQVTLRTSYGWWHTDRDEARSLALALLAAANHAERNQA